MPISQRQGEILNKIVEEYIETAQPVSSHLLGEKYSFGIRPAMIRIEVQQLTNEGYLLQPHTSAGRVPTDKGYRFFVDGLKENRSSNEKQPRGTTKDLDEAIDSPFHFVRAITRILASSSSGLAIGYLTQEKFFWHEGWRDVFQEPEFQERGYALKLVDIADVFEDSLDSLIDNLSDDIQVFIGGESFIPYSEDFSIIISKQEMPRFKQDAVLAILGPKRMAYSQNIILMNSLSKLFQDL